MVTAAPDLEALVRDSALWYEARLIMLPVAKRVFTEAYLLGAALAARETPEGMNPKRRAPEVVIGEMLRVGARAYPGVENGLPIPPPGSSFTPLPFDFDAIATAAEDAIDSYTDDWWRTVEASTQRQMRDTIKRGVRDGLTTRQIIAEFDPLFGPERAANIAISETTTLMGRGAQATYMRAGLRQWIWRTSEDTVVDIDCEGLARASDPKKGGTPFPMTRSFQKAHPRCRCWPVPFGQPTATGEPAVEIPEPAIDVDLGAQYPFGLPDEARFGNPPTGGWFDTTDLHTSLDADGRKVWHANRRPWHNEVTERHLEGATAQENPRAYMMGGGSASGKTTLIKQGKIELPKDIVKIDSDVIKGMQPEYQAMVRAGDPRAASFAHEESSYLSKKILHDASEARFNLMLDGTGDNTIDKLAQKIQDMRFGGHQVIGEYATLDTELAVRNSAKRALETGRDVDLTVIRDTHRAVSEVFGDAVDRQLFDEVKLWDTNIKDQPRLVLEAFKDATGQHVTIHNRQLWGDFLAKADLEPGIYGFEFGAKYTEGLKDTMDLHTFNKKWTRARTAEHDEWIADEIGKATPVDDPVAVMLGGGPATGKTTLIKSGHVKVPANKVSIDSDALKGRQREYRAMVEAGDEAAAAFAHEESSYVSKRLLKEASETKRNLILDGTGDNTIEKLTQKIQDMRLGGHRVVGEYMSLDTELAIQNADIRAIKTGRKVDHEVIRDTHRGVSEVFGEAVERGLFDEVRLWDTNINGSPRLVLEAKKNAEGVQIVTMHDRKLWRDFLAKADLKPGMYSFDKIERLAGAEARQAILTRPDVRYLRTAEIKSEALTKRLHNFDEDFPYPQFESVGDFGTMTKIEQDAAIAKLDAQQATLRKYNNDRAVLKGAEEDARLEVQRLQPEVRQAILEEALYAEEAATITVQKDWIERLRDKTRTAEINKGIEDFKRLVGPNSPVQRQTVTMLRDAKIRASHLNGKVSLHPATKSQTIVHEFGHWIEWNSADVQRLRREHVASRTANDAPEQLRKITGLKYKPDEMTFKDEFFDPYVGRIYRAPGSSEVVSMSLEELYADPIGFARKDPALFDFIYDLLMEWR
jgi:predicted ABC-type ATPase